MLDSCGDGSIDRNATRLDPYQWFRVTSGKETTTMIRPTLAVVATMAHG